MTPRSLDQLAEHIEALWKSSFSDLCFTSARRGNPLTIRIADRRVVKIRFRIEKHDCLHLGKITLIASRPGPRRQNNALALVEGTVEVSSTLPGAESLTEADWVNGSDAHWLTFHTCPEQNPQAVLSLSSAAAIARLDIENRDDEYAPRAWGLKVETGGADGAWEPAYDSVARGEAFVATLLAAYRHQPGEVPLDSELDLTATLLRLMVSGDLRGLEEALHENQAVTHENKVIIQKHLGRIFLGRVDLDWTRHGIARTFRYWNAQQKTDYVQDSMEIVRALKALTDNVSLGYGAVLSFVRDRDLMPHDDDLDIIVALDRDQVGTVSNALAVIENHMRSLGYQVIGDYVSHRQVARPGKKDCDVFVGLIEGQFVSWLPGARGALETADVFPAMDARFLGVKCAFPRNPFVYLETVYGPTWATPLPGWSHDWDTADYADIMSATEA